MEQSNLNRKQIFNPEGDDSLLARKIIGGNSTNLFNLNSVKYTWAKSMYRVMMANFWIPEKVDLSQDISDFNNLTDKEKFIYKSILSFLTFLDSIQTNNIPRVSDYITASEISTLLGIQTYQEIVHSQSYAYIIESIIPVSERDAVYESWRTDDVLFNRNKYIANIYQEFWDNPPTLENPFNVSFARVLVANYILESLYFYNGFMFFYNLSSRNQMLGTADEIRYINRDEEVHVELFANMIKEINNLHPEFITQELVHEMFSFACQEEINWMEHILKDSNILGMDTTTTEKYTKYLINQRLNTLGFEPLYLDYNENPYRYLEMQSDSGSDVKGNFFESTISAYSQSSAIDGWDEI